MHIHLRSPAALIAAQDRAKMSGAELARRVGRSRMSISHLRTGRRKGTDLENARNIADALEVPMKELWRTEDIEAFLPAAR